MPKNINETTICNMALSAAGAANLIGDITTPEDSEEWKMCNLFLWPAIWEAMAASNWKFASDRVALAPDTSDPLFGPYDYKFKLPNDILRPIFVVDKDSDVVHYKYKREGQNLLTNQNPCYLLYLKKVENVAFFPPLFIKAAYTNLAILMRNKLKGADEWFLRLSNEYRGILQDSIGQDQLQDYAIEGNEDVLLAGEGDGFGDRGKFL